MPEPSARTQESVFRRKLTALYQDKRSWYTRLAQAAACSFALCFTVTFYGPLELTAYNALSLGFGAQEVLGLLAAAALAGAAVLGLVLSALRGRLYNYALSVLFALTVGCYLQGNFLNGVLGELTGDAVSWERQARQTMENFALWVCLILAVLTVCYFSRQFWRRMICYGSALIILMQGAGLVSMGVQGLLAAPAPNRAYLTDAHLYEYSSGQNILVILLDRFDSRFLNEVVETDPQFFEFLDGFTSYTNAISPYMRTLPGANAILTGYTNGVYRTPSAEYFESSWDWEGRHLLADLDSAGYSIDIYSQRNYLFGDGPTADTYVRNALPQQGTLSRSGVLWTLSRLSAYRYAPMVFKPSFWTYTDELYGHAALQPGVYHIDDLAFSDRLSEVAVTQAQPAFKFIHMNGSHSPFMIRSDGTPSDTATTAAEQTAGCFCILRELFGRMKELDIYEDTAILITADHGECWDDMAPLSRAVTIGLFYKPAGAVDTPLAYSAAPVSNINLPATILKSAGIDYAAYGPALDDIAEDAGIVRYFYKTADEMVWEDGQSIGTVYVYEVGQDAVKFKNWEIIETYPVEDAFF